MARAFPRLSESLARRVGLEAHEGRLLILMGSLVAILLCAYTIAKVLRDALFLQEFGALALPYAYIGVAFGSVGYVWLHDRLARRFTPAGSSRFDQYVAIALSILAAAALPFARHRTAALFYLWTGSQAMMLIPNFWALALDLWDSRQARRLFPLLSGCGLLGGLTAYLAFNGYQTSTMNFQTFSQVAFAFAVTRSLLVQGLSYALIMGLVGGLMPAIKAARLPIAMALREL